MQVLDARGGMTAPSELHTSISDRDAHLLTIAISSTGQLIAAADSSGALHICTMDGTVEEPETLQARGHNNEAITTTTTD